MIPRRGCRGASVLALATLICMPAWASPTAPVPTSAPVPGSVPAPIAAATTAPSDPAPPDSAIPSTSPLPGPSAALDALASLPSPPATQRIVLEASTEPRVWAPTLAVRLHGADPADLDTPVRVPLVRDPARQGFYVAESAGPARRFLDAELVLVDNGADTPLWRRVVPVEDPDAATLSFLVDQREDGPRATRVAWLPWVEGGNTVGNTVTLAVAFGWGALCFAYVGWLARGRSAR